MLEVLTKLFSFSLNFFAVLLGLPLAIMGNINKAIKSRKESRRVQSESVPEEQSTTIEETRGDLVYEPSSEHAEGTETSMTTVDEEGRTTASPTSTRPTSAAAVAPDTSSCPNCNCNPCDCERRKSSATEAEVVGSETESIGAGNGPVVEPQKEEAEEVKGKEEVGESKEETENQ